MSMAPAAMISPLSAEPHRSPSPLYAQDILQPSPAPHSPGARRSEKERPAPLLGPAGRAATTSPRRSPGSPQLILGEATRGRRSISQQPGSFSTSSAAAGGQAAADSNVADSQNEGSVDGNNIIAAAFTQQPEAAPIIRPAAGTEPSGLGLRLPSPRVAAAAAVVVPDLEFKGAFRERVRGLRAQLRAAVGIGAPEEPNSNESAAEVRSRPDSSPRAALLAKGADSVAVRSMAAKTPAELLAGTTMTVSDEEPVKGRRPTPVFQGKFLPDEAILLKGQRPGAAWKNRLDEERERAAMVRQAALS